MEIARHFRQHTRRLPLRRIRVAFFCLTATLLFSCSARQQSVNFTLKNTRAASSDEEIDAALQKAATAALGTRDGTIVALDPQTGRVRAIVNARTAFEDAMPPGSAIKPFTALAALQAGLIDKDSRVLCRTNYRRDDFETRCSHLKLKPPFDPAHALAYSCNYYFSKVGEKLNAESFAATLNAFGFGARTGSEDEREAAGALPRNEWRVQYALGFGEALLVTPAQLITAYAALFNGGHLYVPQRVHSQNFVKQERAALDIASDHRALLLDGLRGAISYGTAAHAGLNQFPQLVFGKTGTSLPREDFRTHGWFIGFAADRPDTARATSDAMFANAETAASDSSRNLSPSSIRLAVLVFLKHARGSECAALAQNVFAAYARARAQEAPEQKASIDEATTSPFDKSDAPAAPVTLHNSAGMVRVRLVREEMTRVLPLDEYVFGVLAAEASTESNLEALKAQAVVSRTYALRNMNRHARDDYDFCNNTHCQRYIAVADEAARPDFYQLLHRAIHETAGEFLRDGAGNIADAYFSASCGGITADIATLWGTMPAPAYLRGVPDESCASAPGNDWTNVVSRAALGKALHADARSDTGARFDNVHVFKRDKTGRAEMIALEGERRRVLRGWDFKIIVGRELGWDVLKSSRFDVRRIGDSFVFRGSGFGHGLGLCQFGAHAMAKGGASYRQILDHYLPGTRVGNTANKDTEAQRSGEATENVSTKTERSSDSWTADTEMIRAVYLSGGARETVEQANAFQRSPIVNLDVQDASSFGASTQNMRDAMHRHFFAVSPRLNLSSENFQVNYPLRAARRDAEEALRVLEAARNDLSARLKLAGINFRDAPKLELFVYETTGDFIKATGQPVWVAATTGSNSTMRIATQPLETLRRRGVFASTLRHEYAHAVISALGQRAPPRWLSEGLAIRFAGEARSFNRNMQTSDSPLDELNEKLTRGSSSPQEMRLLYAAAYHATLRLIEREGEANVWRRALGR